MTGEVVAALGERSGYKLRLYQRLPCGKGGFGLASPLAMRFAGRLAAAASLPETHWRTRTQPLRPLLAPSPTLREPNSRGRMMRGLHADSAQTCRGGNVLQPGSFQTTYGRLPLGVRGPQPPASFRPFPSVERGPPEALQRKVRSVAPPPAAKAPPAPFPLPLGLSAAAAQRLASGCACGRNRSDCDPLRWARSREMGNG